MAFRSAVLVAGLVLLGCSNSSTPTSTASSSAASSSGPPASSSAAPAASSTCPRAPEPAASGALASSAIDEASGIVASATNRDVFWVHNDSGDAPRVFAVDRSGKLLATLDLDGQAVDVEDIAIEDGPTGASFLYLGDIGDNGSSRPEVTIRRVAEPKLGGPAPEQLRATSETMRVTYADGPHDAETLLFDPITKDLLIATKKFLGGAAIHRVGPFQAGAKVTTERIATAAIDFATGGDISRDGKLIGIRNYGTSASVWVRAPGETLAAALARPPCKVPLAVERQGEAFAFLVAPAGYVTVSEGRGAPLHVALFE